MVEAVQAHDDAFDESLVLVERQERPQGLRRQFVHQHQGRRFVAGADLLRRDLGGLGVVHAQRLAFGLRGFQRLADHEGLALGDDVRQQLLLHVVGRLGICQRGDEFQRHDVVGLVQHLEEGVLGIGALVAEDDGAGLDVEQLAGRAGALTVRFHFQLLQEGGQAAQAVNIGDDRAAGAVQADAVIELGRRQEDRGVLVQRRGVEVLVHRVRAVQQALIDVVAERDDDAQRHGRPQRIAAADPILETEDAVVRDAILAGLVRRGRHGGQVRLGGFFTQPLDQPVAGGQEVGERLLGAEGLGYRDDQGFGRIEAGQGQGQFGTVDIGDKTDIDLGRQRRQGLEQQARTEVRATDTDMDQGLERLAGRAGDRARLDAVGIGLHLVARRLDVGGDLVAAQALILGVVVTQGDVQHGAAFGDVDLLARPHPVARGGDAGGVDRRDGGFEAGPGPALLGDVDIQSGDAEAHAVQPVGIGGELVDDADAGIGLRLSFQGVSSHLNLR